MLSPIEIANDVGPWLAARTFTPADSDVGLLRHVLTIPPDCGSMRLFAAREYTGGNPAGGAKLQPYDDCWELVVCPLSGLRPAADDAVVAAWLWGEGFSMSDPWPTIALHNPRPVLEVAGPASGWAVFARPGFIDGETHVDDVARIHLRAVASGGGQAVTGARIDPRCTVPPAEWCDVANDDVFPAPLRQPYQGPRVWRSNNRRGWTLGDGQTIYFAMHGGLWQSCADIRSSDLVEIVDYSAEIEDVPADLITIGSDPGTTSLPAKSTFDLDSRYPGKLSPGHVWRLRNVAGIDVNMRVTRLIGHS